MALVYAVVEILRSLSKKNVSLHMLNENQYSYKMLYCQFVTNILICI